MTSRRISLQMFPNLELLFDFITKRSNTRAKRLMIDNQSVRKAYNLGKISNTGLSRSENNLAAAFTNLRANSVLRNIILCNWADFQVEQWVYRLNETNENPIFKMEGVWK